MHQSAPLQIKNYHNIKKNKKINHSSEAQSINKYAITTQNKFLEKNNFVL